MWLSPGNHDSERQSTLRTNFADISIDVLQKMRKAREDRRGCTRRANCANSRCWRGEKDRERWCVPSEQCHDDRARNRNFSTTTTSVDRRRGIPPPPSNVSITHRYVEFSEKTYCRRREILRTRLRVPKRVRRVSRSLSSVLKEHSRVSIHMQHRKTLVHSPVRRHSIPLCSTITSSGIILFYQWAEREREREN